MTLCQFWLTGRDWSWRLGPADAAEGRDVDEGLCRTSSYPEDTHYGKLQGHSKKGFCNGAYCGVSVFAEVFAGFGYRDMGAAYEGDGEVAQRGERPCSGA